MKDEAIVGLYWDRNEDAIRQTQLKYGSYLSKVADNILANVEDAQECVNDTYLAAWNSMPTNRPNVLSTYLGKIIRQISIAKKRILLLQREPGNCPSPFGIRIHPKNCP